MKILSISIDKFHVGAVVHERTSGVANCPLLDDFESIEATLQKSRDRLLAYFNQVAKHGLTALNSSQTHQIDPSNGIYELIAGRIRILFFIGKPGNLVVCSHMFIKKTNKTPQKEVAAAIKAKNLYDNAKAQGLVEWTKEL